MHVWSCWVSVLARISRALVGPWTLQHNSLTVSEAIYRYSMYTVEIVELLLQLLYLFFAKELT